MARRGDGWTSRPLALAHFDGAPGAIKGAGGRAIVALHQGSPWRDGWTGDLR